MKKIKINKDQLKQIGMFYAFKENKMFGSYILNSNKQNITDIDLHDIALWYAFSTDDFYIKYELSEDFIRQFKDLICWRTISKDQVLSEEFIIEFQDKINWKNILRYQDLSESFIREFKDKIH